MTIADKARDCARSYYQTVRIVWIDHRATEHGAVEAVELCADCKVSGRIMAAVAQDKALEAMLNKLIDGD